MDDTQHKDAFAINPIKDDIFSGRKYPKSSPYFIMGCAHLRIGTEKIENVKNRLPPSSGCSRISYSKVGKYIGYIFAGARSETVSHQSLRPNSFSNSSSICRIASVASMGSPLFSASVTSASNSSTV